MHLWQQRTEAMPVALRSSRMRARNSSTCLRAGTCSSVALRSFPIRAPGSSRNTDGCHPRLARKRLRLAHGGATPIASLRLLRLLTKNQFLSLYTFPRMPCGEAGTPLVVARKQIRELAKVISTFARSACNCPTETDSFRPPHALAVAKPWRNANAPRSCRRWPAQKRLSSFRISLVRATRRRCFLFSGSSRKEKIPREKIPQAASLNYGTSSASIWLGFAYM